MEEGGEMEILLALILTVGILCLGLLNSISRNINTIKNDLRKDNVDEKN